MPAITLSQVPGTAQTSRTPDGTETLVPAQTALKSTVHGGITKWDDDNLNHAAVTDTEKMKAFLLNVFNRFLVQLVADVIVQKPADPVSFMVEELDRRVAMIQQRREQRALEREAKAAAPETELDDGYSSEDSEDEAQAINAIIHGSMAEQFVQRHVSVQSLVHLHDERPAASPKRKQRKDLHIQTVSQDMNRESKAEADDDDQPDTPPPVDENQMSVSRRSTTGTQLPTSVMSQLKQKSRANDSVERPGDSHVDKLIDHISTGKPTSEERARTEEGMQNQLDAHRRARKNKQAATRGVLAPSGLAKSASKAEIRIQPATPTPGFLHDDTHFKFHDSGETKKKQSKQQKTETSRGRGHAAVSVTAAPNGVAAETTGAAVSKRHHRSRSRSRSRSRDEEALERHKQYARSRHFRSPSRSRSPSASPGASPPVSPRPVGPTPDHTHSTHTARHDTLTSRSRHQHARQFKPLGRRKDVPLTLEQERAQMLEYLKAPELREAVGLCIEVLLLTRTEEPEELCLEVLDEHWADQAP